MAAGIGTVFHYIPLHSSPAGQRYGRTAATLPHTDAASERLVRLPLWVGLEDQQEHVMQTAQHILELV
jgi:dTDP-4-amino-4,6-dideoxygalactose transaminase